MRFYLAVKNQNNETKLFSCNKRELMSLCVVMTDKVYGKDVVHVSKIDGADKMLYYKALTGQYSNISSKDLINYITKYFVVSNLSYEEYERMTAINSAKRDFIDLCVENKNC